MTLVPAEGPAADGAERSARASLAQLTGDPRDDWPPHARRLYAYLAAIYGERDALPTFAAAWIAHQRSDGTRKTYAQNFKILEGYLRERGVHPLALTFLVADTFAGHLKTLPPLVWRGGRRVPEGQPRDAATRHNVLSANSSFLQVRAADPGAAQGGDGQQSLRRGAVPGHGPAVHPYREPDRSRVRHAGAHRPA
ncbi:hypothetical protein [Streptomyces rimosus]|uniref:hypothetical protein n=1 Tax=Streptomyces rimosus TaxID=1927 RepID=UPI0037AFC1CF